MSTHIKSDRKKHFSTANIPSQIYVGNATEHSKAFSVRDWIDCNLIGKLVLLEHTAVLINVAKFSQENAICQNISKFTQARNWRMSGGKKESSPVLYW